MEIMWILIRIPTVIAAIVLVIAAILRTGREKGSLVVLLGAIAFCLAAIMTPIVYQIVIPRLIAGFEPENPNRIFLLVGLIVNLSTAVGILLIAIGTFLRSSRVSNTQK